MVLNEETELQWGIPEIYTFSLSKAHAFYTACNLSLSKIQSLKSIISKNRSQGIKEYALVKPPCACQNAELYRHYRSQGKP